MKRVDKVQIPHTGKWLIVENSEHGPVDTKSDDKCAEYADYAFVVRRKLQQSGRSDFPTITTKILIRSDLWYMDSYCTPGSECQPGRFNRKPVQVVVWTSSRNQDLRNVLCPQTHPLPHLHRADPRVPGYLST